jgi:hypothetical protein
VGEGAGGYSFRRSYPDASPSASGLGAKNGDGSSHVQLPSAFYFSKCSCVSCCLNHAPVLLSVSFKMVREITEQVQAAAGRPFAAGTALLLVLLSVSSISGPVAGSFRFMSYQKSTADL